MQGWNPEDEDPHDDPVTPIQDGLTILAFVLVFFFPWVYGIIGLVAEVAS
jgi:hypothetical protein